MISDRLLALVRCPACHGTLVGDPLSLRCASCGRTYGGESKDFLDLRPHEAFAERTKYLDDALHADARYARVSPPLLGSKIRNDMLRAFLRPGPDDLVVDLGCGSGRALLWNRDWHATSVGIDISPFFAQEARAGVDLLLGDLRRLPFADATFTKAYSLDVLEHLSPEALSGMLREAARVIAPGGELFVYTHVRKNAAVASGLRAINALARRLERMGLIDMRQERLRKSDHLNPLADIPELRRVAADAGFRIRKIRYYTPIVGGFVENILMRLAEKRLADRARGAASATGAMTEEEALRVARAEGKERVATSAGTRGVLRALTAAMKLDLLVFGRIESGPFFALLERIPAPRTPVPAPRSTDHGPQSTDHGPRPTDHGPRPTAHGPRTTMKILYSAIDQPVPGTKGGSIHVAAVAEGLAALGHDVTALVAPGAGGPRPALVHWKEMRPPFGSPHLRLARSGAIRRLVDEIEPDVIIERYHNFGGEAIRAASRVNALAVLEVNAPVIDFPGSNKALLDRALLVEPMRRWREHLCRLSDVIVTPNPAILPSGVPADRVLRLEWGADTDRFRPGAPGQPPFVRLDVTTVAIFAGAFRSWHGAIHLVDAIKALRSRGRKDVGAVLIGDGPELPRVRAAAAGIETIVFTGALPHDRMPAAIAGADIGVAPFDVGAHAPLSLGFYWSPLKIFEYMASGLPVVAPRIDRIAALVEDGVEGVLYPPPDGAAGLADALMTLTSPARRQPLGNAARERAVREYSWAAHCRALSDAITARRR